MPPTRKTKPTAKSATKEAVLKSFSALSADDQEWVIRHQKLSEETTALRARLPERLHPFASTVAVCDPSSEQEVKRQDGANDCGFDFSMSSVSLTITTKTARRKTSEKHLTIESEQWGTASREMTSHKNAIYLSYGPADDKQKQRGVAYIAGYDDPGDDMYVHTTKGVKEILREVVKDMGYAEAWNAGACMRLLDVFVGTLGAHRLSSDTFGEGSLRKVIHGGLEMRNDQYDRIDDYNWRGPN